MNTALDDMQMRSVYTRRVDWPSVRTHALMQARGAQTSADTYPAIRDAVQALGDNHSGFFTPEQWQDLLGAKSEGLGFLLKGNVIVQVYPGGPAAQAGVQRLDEIIALNGTPAAALTAADIGALPFRKVGVARLTLQRAGESMPITVTLNPAEYDSDAPPLGRRLADDISYLALPGFIGSPARGVDYATMAQDLIRANDDTGVRRWVVDLRLGTGGQLYPMLAGVGPIVGDGDLGGFVDASGGKTFFAYRDGVASTVSGAVCAVAHPYHLWHPMPPVAVLTSDLTGSASEAALIAFRGRPLTRTFGEPTFGVPTGNSASYLSDGAVLNLTTALDFDRTGQTYDAPIPPDVAVPIDWKTFSTDSDPVIGAAVAWLRQQ